MRHSHTMLDAVAYSGPIAVTAAYLTYYYSIQLYQLALKKRLAREYKERGERFDRYFGQDREMLAADRYQLNMLEHMPPFLLLLWLHAVFVGPDSATIAGWIYFAARVAYPFVLGKSLKRVRNRVFIVTFTGYGVLAYFIGALVLTAFG